MDQSLSFTVRTATAADAPFAEAICAEMAASALARGTGIARRTPDYIARKMEEGKAVIAFSGTGAWAGFCYIETWSGDYVANSGLIVSPAFRKSGLARRIKERIFQLSREKYPQARIFGLTTGLAVMKINSDLGYEPVTYSELTPDDAFWSGCKSCVNYAILMDKQRKNCLCTAMLYDPAEARPDAQRTTPAAARAEGSGPRATPGERFRRKAKAYARYMRLKTARMLNGRSLLVTFLPFLQPLLQRP
ncbi:MAG: GNAT family N-acetyltransferase [Bacteroidetes bacterium]|nr:GNAT family N-acetyltransferase [Bacteroidota bacterium]